MTTFQHLKPSFHLSVVFGYLSPIGSARCSSLVLVLSILSSSYRPSQGSVSFTSDRFCAFFPFCLTPSLSGWVDVRTMDPQGVGWKTEIVHLECKEERKLERGIYGWKEGGSVGLHLMWGPSKTSRGIKVDHGRPNASSPCQPQGIYPSACFWKNPSSCCFLGGFAQFLLYYVYNLRIWKNCQAL